MKMNRMISFLLCAVLFIGILPSAALAAGDNPFSDVKATDWFYDGALYAYDHGMMNGTGDGKFSPNVTTTRGMIVTILHRLERTPSAHGTAFSDVVSGKWYSDAVNWASSTNIVNGYGNGKFGPEDTITREQMAAILYRYANYKGYDVSASTSLGKYTDASQISSYAVESMTWANASELITGTSSTTLSPKGSATRAQVAVILMRFCSNIIDADGISLNNFGADETYFPVGQNNAITFTVEFSSRGNGGVNLVNGTGQIVAPMHDDGREGDAIANDGIYSYRLSTTANTASSSTYYASSKNVRSNQIVVYFFEQPTEETIQIEENIRQEILNIESEYADARGFVTENKASDALSEVERYARGLQENGDVIFYETSDDGIIIKLSTGLSIYYSPNIEGVDSIGSDVSMTVITCQPCLSMYSGLDKYMALPDMAASEIGSTFSNYAYSSQNNYDNGAVSLERIKSFKSNEIVLWHGHGGYTKSYHSFLLTGEDFDWNAWWWDITYWWDCVQNRIIESSNGRAMISAKYIDKYCGNLDNSFFYLAACQSGKDSVLPNAFLNKGATAVIANTETIYTIYNLLMEYEVAHNLTEINPATDNYYTLSEALSAAKRKHGADDSIWYTGSDPKSEVAAPQIFGGVIADNYRLADASDSIAKNNHYEIFNFDGITWENAKQYCESIGGHLATITSKDEQDYIASFVQSSAPNTDLWIGIQSDWSEWITGEAVQYTNWGINEPDGTNGQCYGVLCNGERSGSNAMGRYSIAVGQWDDLKNGDSTNSGGYFICEWETDEAYNKYMNRPQALDEHPFEQNYWIIFTEGSRNNRVEASTISSTISPQHLYIIWDKRLVLNNTSGSGRCNQFFLNEGDEWENMGDYHRLSDNATNIIASNLDVYDRNGNLIVAKSPYSDINWALIHSYR